jgi:hypothetical protein
MDAAGVPHPQAQRAIRGVVEGLSRVSGVQGAMLIDRDGMVIVADVPAGVNDERVAAMAAAIAATTQESLEKIGRGPLTHMQMDADSGRIFLEDGGLGFLVVLAEPSVNIGLVRLEMRAASQKLRRRPAP